MSDLFLRLTCASFLLSCGLTSAHASPNSLPSASDRAGMLLQRMTLEEKLGILMTRGGGGLFGIPIQPGALGSAAYLPFPAHFHLPTLQITDAGLGVGNPGHVRKDGAAVSLPSGLATASTWDNQMAFAAGAMIGEEAWRQGFNILLGGGADLTRDPRGGRNFEYAGEDPVLTGQIVGHTIAGIQSRHVLSTIKHFAMNDLETSRMTVNAVISPAALRESDLLGFEIAIEAGHPGSVMCSYNRLNDLYACDNPYLLTQTLKQDWHYPGFVMSDWGADHTTARAALAGLDQESDGPGSDSRPFFGPLLAQAVQNNLVPHTRIDDMARRILSSIYAVGLADHPPVIQPLNVPADTLVAQRDEEEGAVLLKNDRSILPLSRNTHIAVIGGHADKGVLSGGGSAQVDPIGGNAVAGPGNKDWPGDPVYFPTSPLKALKAEAPSAWIDYASGDDVHAATDLARRADVVIIFATKWSYESVDSPDLSLPDHQDELIASIARVNPHCVVVLETGNPVLMPWLPQVSAVMEAWYPGSGGGPAIARLLFGSVAPSGHLPMTFPASASQLAHPDIAGVSATTVFDVQFHTDQQINYDEGSDVGYRWFDAKNQMPLFPFGTGLTYTTFENSAVQVTQHDHVVSARFTVRNSGSRAGTTVPQVYVALPSGTGIRLAGWKRLSLAPGQSETVTVPLESRVLAHFDAEKDEWAVPAGLFRFWVGNDARDRRAMTSATFTGWSMNP